LSLSSKQARFSLHPDVRYRPMASGGMLVNLATGACFELNRSAAELLTHLLDGATVGGAIDTVQKKYRVALDVVETDALQLCDELLRAGLVTGNPVERDP